MHSITSFSTQTVKAYLLLLFKNPLPGLHPLQRQVSSAKIDEDYHLCPLPRYKLGNKSGSDKPSRAFIERPVSSLGPVQTSNFSCAEPNEIEPKQRILLNINIRFGP